MKHCNQPVKVAGAKAKKMIGALVMMGHKVMPVGSRCVEGGARHGRYVKPSDWDYVVSADSTYEATKTVVWELRKNGFEEDGSKVDDSKFTSVSFFDNDNQRINFIVSHSEQFYNEFVAAQELVNSCKLTNKASRIAVFGHVRGTDPLNPEELDKALANGVVTYSTLGDVLAPCP